MARDPILDRLKHQKLGLLVEQGGSLLFASDREPMVALRVAHFQHHALLDGADVALPAVGLAAAYLLILSNVGRVFSGIMTVEARRALDEEGIEHSSVHYPRRLPEPYATASERLDVRAREAVTPQAFLDELKRMRE